MRQLLTTAVGTVLLAITLSAAAVTQPPVDQTLPTRVGESSPPEPQLTGQAIEDRWEEVFRQRRYRRSVFRIGQDYRLREGESVRDVTVAFGAAEIEGRVSGTLVVLFGPVRLASTAIIDGALVVVGGDATVAPGAVVRNDVVTIGSSVDLPGTFVFGGEHIVVGSRLLGERMAGVLPWVTRGLLFGRPIAPGVGWVWSVVGLFGIVYLMLNLLAHEPVRASAEVLATRPFGSFVVGLLVLLLVGPVSALMIVSVLGIAVLPFALAALVVAGVLGRVTVLRRLGDAVMAPDDPDSRVQALRSLVIGFVLLTLIYLVPVLGLVTWALIGVVGLGAVVLAFLAAWRRERPRPEPSPVAPSDPVPPVSPVSPTQPAADQPPPPPSPSFAIPLGAAEPSGGTAASGAPAGDLTLYPRATFLDRAGALVVDVVLVAIAYQVLSGPLFWRGDDVMLPLLLVYFVGFWAWKGTTMGGIVTNLRVVKTTGAPVEFVDAMIRGLMGVLSFAMVGIGVLWILRDPEGQAWHDKAAGTYVVKVPRSMSVL